MKKHEEGFSLIEVLVVIVIIGLLATVGWLVYDRQNNKTPKPSSDSTVEQTKKEPDTPKTTNYKSDELGLSLTYPAEWGTASLADGPFLTYQKGLYKQLTFSKSTDVTVNFVMGPYSSPLDACGYDDVVKNAQHEQNANQASLVGWDDNSIKIYALRQGSSGPAVYKESKTPSSTSSGYSEVSRDKNVMAYKAITIPAKAGDSGGCSTVTQAKADEANAYSKFIHYALNYKNSKVFGVNGQFDGRKGDNATVSNQLIEVLNSIK